MIDFLLAPGMAPFSFAFLLVAGLVLLEIVFLMLGGSLLGMDADAPAMGAEPEFDFDLEIDADFDPELGVEPELEVEAPGQTAPTGPMAWLGVGEAPFILWLAGAATSFGVAGYGLQLAANGLFGGLAPAALAAAIAAIPGLIGARFIARAIAALAPKTETSATSRRHLGGRLGVVTQGTATKGRPAQARITDRHGNIHYLRVEPRHDGVEIPQGTDVIIFRPVGDVYPVVY